MPQRAAFLNEFGRIFAGKPIIGLRNTLLDARRGQGIKIELELLVFPTTGKLPEHQARLNVSTVLILAAAAFANVADDFMVSDLADLHPGVNPNRLNGVEFNGPMAAISDASKPRRSVHKQYEPR